MAGAQIKLSDIADLIRQGQTNTDQRFKDLREDFEEKHQENRERRHQLGQDIGNIRNEMHLIEKRVVVLEQDMRTVVGDNSGESGLLHKIDEKVDTLQSEFSGIKKVLAFLAFLIMAGIGVLALIYHH